MFKRCLQILIVVLTLAAYFALFGLPYFFDQNLFNTIVLILCILLSPLAYLQAAKMATIIVASYGADFPLIFLSSFFYLFIYFLSLYPHLGDGMNLVTASLVLVVACLLALVIAWVFRCWYGKTHRLLLPILNIPITYYDYYRIYKQKDSWQYLARQYDNQLRAESRVPIESFYLNTSYGPTHVLAAGNAANPPLVLLHSLDDNALQWQEYLPLLTPYFRVYAPDILGTRGKSMPKRLDITGWQYGIWLIDVMQGLGLSKADFVAEGSGCSLIFKLAQAEPSYIRRAVLITPNHLVKPIISSDALSAGRSAMNRPTENNVRHLLEVLGVPGRATPEAFVSKAIAELEILKNHYRSFAFSNIFPYLEPDELKQLTVPTLLLLGSVSINKDTDRQMAQAKRYIPNLKMQLVFGTNPLLSELQVAPLCSHISSFLLS